MNLDLLILNSFLKNTINLSSVRESTVSSVMGFIVFGISVSIVGMMIPTIVKIFLNITLTEFMKSEPSLFLSNVFHKIYAFSLMVPCV